MKTLLLALCLSLCSFVALADEIPTVNLIESEGSDGQTVKLMFGWHEGNLLCASNGKAKGKGNMTAKKNVIVPDNAAARAWMASLPTKENSPSTQFAYVKVHANAVAELLGRTLKDGQPAW